MKLKSERSIGCKFRTSPAGGFESQLVIIPSCYRYTDSRGRAVAMNIPVSKSKKPSDMQIVKQLVGYISTWLYSEGDPP
jgi:hypothetical protein